MTVPAARSCMARPDASTTSAGNDGGEQSRAYDDPARPSPTAVGEADDRDAQDPHAPASARPR